MNQGLSFNGGFDVFDFSELCFLSLVEDTCLIGYFGFGFLAEVGNFYFSLLLYFHEFFFDFLYFGLVFCDFFFVLFGFHIFFEMYFFDFDVEVLLLL